jgi:ABC-type molybdate transport system substrate-binding protein
MLPASLGEREVLSKALGEDRRGNRVPPMLSPRRQGRGIDIPENNVIATYPVAVTKAAPNPDGAQEFVDFVLSDQGQKVLASYGFTSP